MRRLGDLLLERGLITDHDYAEAERVQRQSGELIGELDRSDLELT